MPRDQKALNAILYMVIRQSYHTERLELCRLQFLK